MGRIWSATATIEWLILEGWRIEDSAALIRQVGERLVADGVPLWRIFFVVPTLHPRYLGSAFRWTFGEQEVFSGLGDRNLQQSPTFRDSPVRLVMVEHYAAVRRRLEGPDFDPNEFPVVQELAEQGATDYVCMAVEFAGGERSAISFATRASGGFAEAHLTQINDLLPVLSRLVERQALRSTTVNLLDTYVGHDAGARILDGQIEPGMAESIYAAVWYCDLRGFTALSEALPGTEVIRTLNAYFTVMAEAVAGQGGEILKYIGDGLMAIFPVGDTRPTVEACRQAVAAAASAETAMAALNDERRAGGETPLDFGIALHVGEVMYGNIGGADRLDFTVIGPAVNLACRMEGLCKELQRRPLMSAAFVEAWGRPATPVGSFALPGLSAPVAVFAAEDWMLGSASATLTAD